MKSTILLLLLTMSVHSFSQSRFSKRRYMKGMFNERVHPLKLKPGKSKESGETSPKTGYRLELTGMFLYADVTDTSITPERIAKPIAPAAASPGINNDTNDEWTHPGIRNKSHKRSEVHAGANPTSFLQKPVSVTLATKKENNQHKHTGSLCVSEKQKRTEGFFWREFFDRENLQHLRFKDCSLQNIGLGLIEYYQNYISPKKGFGCSYRLFAHDDSCSEYGKKAIRDQGIFIGSVSTLFRLGACDGISRKMNRRGLCMSDEECGSLMFIGWGH